jgi:Flp pilus assembly pilin Flp
MDAVTKTDTRRESGQTMAEYAIVLGVISITTVTAFGLFGAQVGALIQAVAETIGL